MELIKKMNVVLNIIVACFALVISLSFTSIVGLLSSTYTFLASSCLVPFLGGLLWKKGTAKGSIKTRLFIVFIIALILFILALINSYISSRITNPIKELEKSVGILEEGNLDVPVYAGGSYEIQHLGKSIGDMAAQIN